MSIEPDHIESGEDLAPRLRARVDVVVIGSGAGGAVTTLRLARAGLDVLCLEEGPWVRGAEFTGRSLAAQRQLYRFDGMTAALGQPTVIVPLGSSIGGTTTINAGTCFRTPDDVVHAWQRDFGLPITPDEMAPYFDWIEGIMPVAPPPEKLLGSNSRIVLDGARRLGWAAAPIPRNAPTCKGCCRCVLGCPENAKLSMNLSFVPAGIRAGARYTSRTRVDRIRRTRTGVRLEGALLSRDGKRKVGDLKIEARAVVLACGAIYTPILLKQSGLGTSSRHVGRHLRLHPATRAIAVFDQPVEGWKGVLQGAYVDEFSSEGTKMEGVFVSPGLLAPSLPFLGQANTEIMERFRNIAIFGTMATDESEGFVGRGPGRWPTIAYRLRPIDAQRIKKGVWALARIYFEMGARDVYTGIFQHEHLRTMDDANRMLAADTPPSSMEALSMHPHGSVRMAAEKRLGALDPDGCVWGTERIYVADGSVFPRALGVNPQLSIMAMSARIADGILRRHFDG